MWVPDGNLNSSSMNQSSTSSASSSASSSVPTHDAAYKALTLRLRIPHFTILIVDLDPTNTTEDTKHRNIRLATMVDLKARLRTEIAR